MQRFFFNTQPLVIGDLHILNQELLHHFRVLRLQKGDHINLFSGDGKESQATIIDLNKQAAIVNIKKIITINRELPFQICLVQGLCANEKMDWLIEKSVELGVYNIQPIICSKKLVKIIEKKAPTKQRRWNKQIISACEQCGRNVLPTIGLPVSFEKWITHSPLKERETNNALFFILSPGNTTPFKDTIPKKQPNYVEILIGPEGGFSKQELDFAELRGYKPITMGPRTLRTETAGIAMISALSTYWNAF